MSNPTTEAQEFESNDLCCLLSQEKTFFAFLTILLFAVLLSFIMGYVAGKQVGFADGRGMTLLEAQKVEAGHYIETTDGTRFIWTPPQPLPIKRVK